ncbi:MAG: deoxyribonuclease IV [Syntrophobacteraceae bacterium]|nr:deoxyribonuclease IV [Syntrophobacteraceae bacterium]
MPYLGAHISTAGGIHLVFDRLEKIKGRALQLFTTNQRQWRAAELGAERIALFKSRWKECGAPPLAAHDSYLINLAAQDEQILQQSVAAFAEELKRCEALGIAYLVMHPGAHGGQGSEPGLLRLVKNLDLAIETSRVESVSVLIENTAGQGSSLGSSFEEIGFILQTSAFGSTMGICYDTCHGFAAGYDIRDAATYGMTFKKLDETIGLERLKFFHINDCKRELGARVDRHEHIGKGKIGLRGFGLLLNDPRFARHPMVLETPKGKDMKEDVENLGVLNSLFLPPPPH